jgi:ankyrin repeat protein
LALPDALSRAFEAAKAGDSPLLRTLLLDHGVAFCRAPDSLKHGGSTPAHVAARNGHADCLRTLHELGAAASLVAALAGGWTPAHAAAMNGRADCLRALHELGAAAGLVAAGDYGATPAHAAAQNGHADCLRMLHELGAAASFVVADDDGFTPARLAAQNGHADCLRALHELGAAAGLVAADDYGATPAHAAARNGHADCLRALHELGAPNPHSATAAGPDHLSYFALLGRIAGLALCHCEPLTASWSSVREHNLGPHLFQLVENFARTSPRAHPHAHPHTTAPLSPHALRACCVVGRSS